MDREYQIEWREPTDDEIQHLTGDRPDERSGDPDETYESFSVYQDQPGGGVIFHESDYLTPSAWSTNSDEDLRAAWRALTGQRLGEEG